MSAQSEIIVILWVVDNVHSELIDRQTDRQTTYHSRLRGAALSLAGAVDPGAALRAASHVEHTFYTIPVSFLR